MNLKANITETILENNFHSNQKLLPQDKNIDDIFDQQPDVFATLDGPEKESQDVQFIDKLR